MRAVFRWIALVLCALLALQLFFIARIALMAVVDPQSTSFQRSEAWRTSGARWQQQWVGYARISDSLKRAVIASEDGDYMNHQGVEWEAVRKAWEKNERAEERAARQAPRPSANPSAPARAARPPKIVGGSTITQQLAKNLLLSGERTLLRKAQELVLTLTLEAVLSKQRILELYLNSVEWGEGVFGAEAAARHYFRKSAAQLTPYEAARLSVMLPRPKFFEKVPNSPYLAGRAQTIVARMGDAQLP